ncbi:MAG: hypothetical protein RR394_07675 [Oscillospiraceae bacterium]
MKQPKRIISLVISMLMITVFFCGIAEASEAISTRAYVTKRISKTYTEVLPAWNGSHGNYLSFPIEVTVTSNINFNFATGKIAGYSTPSISMQCARDDRLVSTIAGAPTCSISSDGYNLLVTHASTAYTGYLWFSVIGVGSHEYTYHALPTRTVTLSPQ